MSGFTSGQDCPPDDETEACGSSPAPALLLRIGLRAAPHAQDGLLCSHADSMRALFAVGAWLLICERRRHRCLAGLTGGGRIARSEVMGGLSLHLIRICKDDDGDGLRGCCRSRGCFWGGSGLATGTAERHGCGCTKIELHPHLNPGCGPDPLDAAARPEAVLSEFFVEGDVDAQTRQRWRRASSRASERREVVNLVSSEHTPWRWRDCNPGILSAELPGWC